MTVVMMVKFAFMGLKREGINAVTCSNGIEPWKHSHGGEKPSLMS
jgi:hypothetical protein